MILTDLSFNFKIIQFPVKILFVVTINKAEGQILKYIDIDL